MDAFPLLDRFPADWAGAERARGAVAATVAGVAGSAADAALRAAPVAVARYHTARPSRGEESPLFGRRGPLLA
jgi:hypothetical protein